MSSSTLDLVCEAAWLSETVVVLEMILLVMLGMSWFFLEPGSASYVVAQIGFVMILVTLTLFVGLRLACRSRAPETK